MFVMLAELPPNNVLFAIWWVIDLIFSGIDKIFMAVFMAIPPSAIPYLESIFCYSILAVITVLEEKGKFGSIDPRIIRGIFMIFFILFSIWRLGVVYLIDDAVLLVAIGLSLLNVFYMILGALMIYSFVKKLNKVKKVMIIALWILFFLHTFIISSILGESELNFDTLVQFLFVAAIFVVPSGLVEYKNIIKGDD